MKGLEKRLVVLESKTAMADNSLDHLTDEELKAYAIDLIARMADEAGLVLPDDWQEQYERSPIRFSEAVERQIKEMLR